MKTRRASGTSGRLGELLLGGAVGLGAPVMVRGLSRVLGVARRGPAVGGWTAGLLGALVAGGLARRRGRMQGAAGRNGPAPEGLPPEVAPHRHVSGEPRRGPNGRERLWETSGQPEPA